MMSRKQLVALVILVFLIAAASIWFANTREPFQVYESFGDYLDAKPRSASDIERYTENLKAAYAADTFGGETPEETLQLFKEALEAGDTDLAAKYFVLEKQESKAAGFAQGKENGILHLFIEDLELPREGKLLFEGNYRFRVYSTDGLPMGFNLVKNPYSSVWKIDSL